MSLFQVMGNRVELQVLYIQISRYKSKSVDLLHLYRSIPIPTSILTIFRLMSPATTVLCRRLSAAECLSLDACERNATSVQFMGQGEEMWLP